ncbi:MAG TPA: ABC transporter permease [Bacteroidales bacterium]|nr:ABC transporter permease [Bacteroidales bacterium]
MFSNFIKVAYRVFLRDRIHTLINIFGLAIGLAFSIIIFLYVNKEISYDRFHENAQRLYRIGVKGRIAENIYNHAVTPAPLAGTMIREIPGIENSVRLARFGAWLVRYDSARYNEDNIIFADSGFFNIFSFPLVSGKPEEVLKYPNSIVLSERSVLRYFGNTDPVGKMLRIENDSTYYTVTGIMKDIPENSHLHFDMAGSLSTFKKYLHDDRWVVSLVYTYVLIKDGYDPGMIRAGLPGLVADHVIPDYKKLLNISDYPEKNSSDYFDFVLQPITDIHLKSDFSAEFGPVGKLIYIYLFTALAIAILVLSCINFISLVTARSVHRAREVGIRKIAGSDKGVLVKQFLLESSLLAFFSMALALLFTELALPVFNRYMDLDLRLAQLFNPSGAILIITLILVIGLVSGLYPALHLSAFEPVPVLRNWLYRGTGRNYFRTGLVLFQLFIAVGVFSMTLIVSGQYRYLTKKDLGFDRDNLLVIRRSDGLKEKLDDYKSQIALHHAVLSVTSTTHIPGGGFSRTPYYLSDSPVIQNLSASNLLVSYDFDSTYRITMAKGRFFDRRIPDDSAACVINETMARELGIDDPEGNKLVRLTGKPGMSFEFNIIGIVQDFHFETLENDLRPLVILLMPGKFEGYLTVRITPEDREATLMHLKTTWEKYTTAYPFVSFYLDENLKDHYHSIRETGRIFSVLAIVSLLIAGLGLFALVTYAYYSRKQEIGIRKTLGADTGKIIRVEIRQLIMLVTISSAAAWIGVYFLVSSWLNDYANRINLNVLYFLIPLVLVLLASLLTIYYQAWLSASTNPGTVLKHE